MEKIVCKNVTKIYPDGNRAVSNLNLSIDVNGIFSLIGRNGAGKTTLVRMLATELMPNKGSINICGLDLIKDADKIREIIAIVPQESRPVPWMTPEEQIIVYLLWRGFGYGEAKRRATDALKMLEISRYAKKLNERLSGGTKRKVLLASAIASDARILFLDEPTTGLDPISRNKIWDLLLKLKKDRFIFLTTHYLEESERLADKIGILENGKLLIEGGMEELRTKLKFPYSIKIAGDRQYIKPKNGFITKGIDGSTQILTTQKEAYRLTGALIKKGIKFSIDPISLEDIFYKIVKRDIISEEYEKTEHE